MFLFTLFQWSPVGLAIAISRLFSVEQKGSYSLTKRPLSVGTLYIMLSDTNNLSRAVAKTSKSRGSQSKV